MGSSDKLEEEVLAHAEMAKRLEECGVLLARAIKKLSEKQKLILEQSRVIVEKEKESNENMEAVKSVNKSMSFISRTKQLMQLPVMMSKNTLTVVKSGIGFHKFRHNNIQIINFIFKILASNFFLFVECLIVNVVE